MNKVAIGVIAAAILLGLFVAGPAVARGLLGARVSSEARLLFAGVSESSDTVTEQDLEPLPENVRQWLQGAGVVGKKPASAVRLRQSARMRLEPEGSWMPVEAVQYFVTQEPGFIWAADVRAAPLVHIKGIDRYLDGRGHMQIRLLSLFPVADSRGEEIDQGTLLRYLVETVWFPSAVLGEHIVWEGLDESRSQATMTYGGITASAVFVFNEAGDVVNVHARRYGEFDGEFRLETWSIDLWDHGEFDGIRIPARGEITWKLEGGDFHWFDFHVMDIEYDTPVPYV